MLKSKLVMALAVGLVALVAGAVELKEVRVDQFGYALDIPEGFALEGKIDNTTTWIRHNVGGAPAAAAEEAPASEEEGKKKGFGAKLKKGIKDIGKSEASSAAPASGGSAGASEPALTIYVNWVYMPDVSSGQMYDINRKSMQDKINGPNPDYTDLKELKIKDGHAFWYKEVNKDAGDEIHRWHINAYGNKSAYTVGLTGTYAQFEQWGPVYEKVIESFEFVPLKG